MNLRESAWIFVGLRGSVRVRVRFCVFVCVRCVLAMDAVVQP